MTANEMQSMIEQVAQAVAARMGEAPVETPTSTPVVNTRGKGKKNGSPSVSFEAGLSDIAAQLSASRVKPAESARKTAAKSVCGVRKDGTGEPCPKCAGEFNPVKHYSLVPQSLRALDGGPVVTVGNCKDKLNNRARVFIGLSGDPEHAGKIVVVGIGHQAAILEPAIARALKAAL